MPIEVVGKSVDLADVVEQTRSLKRRLCNDSLSFSTGDVFKEPFIDRQHLSELAEKLSALLSCANFRDRAEAQECLAITNRLVSALDGDPDRPSDDELCRRFSEGSIDARTVIHLTRWTPDELFDACERLGLPV